MTEKVLLNSGYKYFEGEHPRDCDRFYVKTISSELSKSFRVYYYDKFGTHGELDYDFEYEYVEERNNYWYKTYLWGMNKDIPYTIEEIEDILQGKKDVYGE